jgi:hypothetical protein
VNVGVNGGRSERRQKVLASSALVGGLPLNGIDYLEVLDQDAPSDDLRQRLIDLVFLKPEGVLDGSGAPVLTTTNITIEGGTRVRSVSVTAVAAGADAQTLRLTLSEAGDFSTYTLRLRSALDDDTPPGNMDPVLSSIEFSFKADCPSDFDCEAPEAEAAPASAPPPLDYLAKDYESFRRLMLDRMAVTLPRWTERSPADLGVALVETLAYAADMTSYYQDAVATESYLATARRRESVRRHARLLGYKASEGSNARVWIAIDAAADADSADPPLVPAGTPVLTRAERTSLAAGFEPAIRPDPVTFRQLVDGGALVFETLEDVTSLAVDRNAIRLHAWGMTDSYLPIGSTVAYLVDTAAGLGLSSGDVLVFEERLARGMTADDPPDPAHRQAVRLAADPVSMTDPLDGTSVLEVTWHAEDALTFELNLGSIGAAPGAVARGNVVLADHGRTRDYIFASTEDAATVASSLHADLSGTGLEPGSAGTGRYRPRLAEGPVTQAAPFDAPAAREHSAAATLVQDDSEVVPAVVVEGDGEAWQPRADLLGSSRFAREFVVESDNEGNGTLRFGDGQFGKAPSAATYRARFRVGTGPDGLIGAGAIGHIVTDDPDLIDAVTNPLPAQGGADAERTTTTKINAPRAFRTQKRAVTADDYASRTGSHSSVQRAVAERRWTGSWHTFFIAVDPAGGGEVSADLESTLRGHIEPYRLAGHDVEIEAPEYVPLDIALVVCVAEGHYAADVEQALLDRFSARLLPDGTAGFFHHSNFTFGTAVRLSRVIAAAMAVPGVQWIGLSLEGVEETGRFRRLFEQDIDYGDTGVIPIDAREVARLDNDPSAPDHGRLQFIMEGGR